MNRIRLGNVLAVVLLSAGIPSFAGPTVNGCAIFPVDNYWNTPIDTLPLHPSSDTWVTSVGKTARLHADWGAGVPPACESDDTCYGIPFTTVTSAQAPQFITHDPDPDSDYSDESDNIPFPIPSNAPIEGGAAADPLSDRHVLVIETTNCVLYELYHAFNLGGGLWQASSWAHWPLGSNALRPADWTSADAAGLPIFPGLVRWEEVAAGEIAHAIRFTANHIWGMEAGHIKYLWPARHNSGTSTNTAYPPMGARFRLKASFNIETGPYGTPTKVILRAFKKYGLVLADGGSNWYFQGVANTNWPDAVFSELGSIAGDNFEVVDTSLLQVDPNSAKSALPDLLVTRYRLYSAGTFEHLYTTDFNEYSVLPVCCAWQPEGAIYRIFRGPGTYGGVTAVPYYRLYNPSSFQHHWTSDANEYSVLPSLGWTQEGIDGYILPSAASGALPLYRLYLNAAGGLHVWTTDSNEKNVLTTTQGWVDEGIAGYVMPLP